MRRQTQKEIWQQVICGPRSHVETTKVLCIGKNPFTKAKINGVPKNVYIYLHINFFFINFWPSLAPLQIHAVHQHSLFLSKNKFTHDLLQVHTVRQQCRLWLFVTLCIHFRFVGLHAEIETVTQVQSACCSENQALVQRYYIQILGYYSITAFLLLAVKEAPMIYTMRSAYLRILPQMCKITTKPTNKRHITKTAVGPSCKPVESEV